ncbi:hypothetical protein HDA32_003499 [Spinactinospora alkalitolerans]|uniref:Uncharacterized protein n=1 Tax=Spinactinospora alkalitolerans TaxID=687207 RepID=A0A852TWJ1_9ACTN|nr:hypothetical protein [Spinactinospora alkalitolerans]NYE48379.1 hypothetical protein [Spinactinospora alkalitolerans]
MSGFKVKVDDSSVPQMIGDNFSAAPSPVPRPPRRRSAIRASGHSSGSTMVTWTPMLSGEVAGPGSDPSPSCGARRPEGAA